MSIAPSSLLSLPIIGTGTEANVWGDVVNNGLTQYLDIAIAGGLPISITGADVTLTNTAGTSSATGFTSTTAQYAILNISGVKTAARNLNLPVPGKQYTINNAGTGGFLLTVRGVTPTTGVTLLDGEKAIVAWDGSDYVKISSSVVTAFTGTLPVANGGTGATTLTANNVLLGNGTSAPSFVAPSTSGNVLTSNGTTWQSTAPAVGYVGPNVQVFTSNGTFTVPAGITKIIVTAFGGGGGAGGGGYAGYFGGNGGAGGVGIASITGLTPGASITVTLGSGGAGGATTGSGDLGSSGTSTTFGSYVTATGGGGGGAYIYYYTGASGSFSTTGTVLLKNVGSAISPASQGGGSVGGSGIGAYYAGGGGGGGMSGGGGGGGGDDGGAGGAASGPGANGVAGTVYTAGAGGGSYGGAGGATSGGGGGGTGGVIVQW